MTIPVELAIASGPTSAEEMFAARIAWAASAIEDFSSTHVGGLRAIKATGDFGLTIVPPLATKASQHLRIWPSWGRCPRQQTVQIGALGCHPQDVV